MNVSWDGGTPKWHARGVFVMHGPEITRVCWTKVGAQFAAWRQRRREAASL